MKKPRRATLVLWIVVVAVVGVMTAFYVTSSSLRNRIFTKRVPENPLPSFVEGMTLGDAQRVHRQISQHPMRRWVEVKRWSVLPLPNWKDKSTSYYLENGLLAEDILIHAGSQRPVSITRWGFDGVLLMQTRGTSGRVEHKYSAPWWWNVTDQTEPTDPQWIAEHGKQ